MAENKKLNPQDADVRVILHTPDDTYSEEDKMFMDLDNLAKQGIDPNNDDEVMTSKVPMTSRAMKGRLDVVPENKIIGAVTNMFGAIGDALDSIEVAKRLGNLINYEQRSIPVPTNLNDLITRTEITPDMEKTAFEKAVNAKYRIDFNKMETTDVNLKTLLEAVDLPLSELLGFGAAERVSKELATGFTPEKEDVADVLLSATGVPAAAVGVAKGTRKAAKALQPKAVELFEEGFNSFEDFFGMKNFVVPNKEYGVRPVTAETIRDEGGVFQGIKSDDPAGVFVGYSKDEKPQNLNRLNITTGGYKINPDGSDRQFSFTGKIADVTPIKFTGPTDNVFVNDRSIKGKIYKTNLFTAKQWKWTKVAPRYKNIEKIGSIEGGGKHYYTLSVDFPNGANFATYPARESNPRMRPTIKGKLEFGNVVGEIKTNKGKIHPVYDNVKMVSSKKIEAIETPNVDEVSKIKSDDVVNNNEKMIGTAIPKKVKRDIVNVNNNADFENFANMEKKIIQNVKLMSLSPSIKNVAQTKEGAEQIVELLKDNIRFIYNNASEAIKVGAKEWYVGANKIAKQMAEKYNLNDAQTSAILAALSPQKDWNQNVSLAERVAKILSYDVDVKVDDKVLKKVKELYNPNEDIYYVINYGTKKQYYNSKKAKGTLENKISFAIKNLSLEDVDKMKFPQLTPEQEARRKVALKALILRAIDETNYDRSFRKINYDGSYGDTIITKTGETDTAAWQDYDSIGKAVKIFEDGSIKNINVSVGNGHKVRSFYNNIVNPDADNIVTVDTHAVAAAQLRPLGAKDLEPSNAFGTHNKKELLQDERLEKLGIGNMTGPAGNDTIGEYGTYSFYKKAYDEVAKEFGLKSRELQSIVWEGVREFFPDTFKSTQNKKTIDNIWLDWKAGNISVEEARKQITDFRNKNVGGVNE